MDIRLITSGGQVLDDHPEGGHIAAVEVGIHGGRLWLGPQRGTMSTMVTRLSLADSPGHLDWPPIVVYTGVPYTGYSAK